MEGRVCDVAGGMRPWGLKEGHPRITRRVTSLTLSTQDKGPRCLEGWEKACRAVWPPHFQVEALAFIYPSLAADNKHFGFLCFNDTRSVY